MSRNVEGEESGTPARSRSQCCGLQPPLPAVEGSVTIFWSLFLRRWWFRLFMRLYEAPDSFFPCRGRSRRVTVMSLGLQKVKGYQRRLLLLLLFFKYV